MKIVLSALVSLVLLTRVAAPVAAQTAEGSLVDAKSIAEALKAGGYVILLRHGATFSNQADTDPFNLADTSKQRNLNDKGMALAKAFW